MPRNGSGVYNLPPGINPVVPNTAITSEWANNTLQDMAAALSQSLARDGQTSPTANLPMGGFRHTNVSDPSARNQYASLGWVQDGFHIRATSVGGTNDMFAQLLGGSTTLQTGQILQLTNVNTNTGPLTLNLNSIGAKAIVRPDGSAFAAGQFVAGVPYILMYDGTKWICANLPAVRSIDIADAPGITFSGGPITDAGIFTPELSAGLLAWNGINPATKANVAGQAFTGPISATTVSGSSGVYSVTHFISTTTSAALSTASAGVVYLRPNDAGSAVGQLALDSQGNCNIYGAVANSARINLICGTSNGIPGITFSNNAMVFKGGVYWNGPTDSIDFFTSSDGANPRMVLLNNGRLRAASGYEMGVNVAASGNDLSKHLALYGSAYGFSITSGTLNAVADSVVVLSLTATVSTFNCGININGALAVTGAVSGATVADSFGNVRKLTAAVSNAHNTSDSTWCNKAIEKSDNGSYNYTIAAGTGTHSDAITFVNSGTAGTITLVQGSGVAIMKSGVVANVVIPPGSIVTIYHSATANRWIA